jgi:hypothetical protein
MGLPPGRVCLSKQQQPAALAASATASLLGDEFSLAIRFTCKLREKPFI